MAPALVLAPRCPLYSCFCFVFLRRPSAKTNDSNWTEEIRGWMYCTCPQCETNQRVGGGCDHWRCQKSVTLRAVKWGEKKVLSFLSGVVKIQPCVYKELLVDPSGKVMKETSRHFFKIYFYWTINEYYKIKALVCFVFLTDLLYGSVGTFWLLLWVVTSELFLFGA